MLYKIFDEAISSNLCGLFAFIALVTYGVVKSELRRESRNLVRVVYVLAIFYAVEMLLVAAFGGFGYPGPARAFNVHVNPYALIALGSILLLVVAFQRTICTFGGMAGAFSGFSIVSCGVLAVCDQPLFSGLALVATAACVAMICGRAALDVIEAKRRSGQSG